MTSLILSSPETVKFLKKMYRLIILHSLVLPLIYPIFSFLRHSFFLEMMLHSSPTVRILKAYSRLHNHFDFFSLNFTGIQWWNKTSEAVKFNNAALLLWKNILSLKSQRITNLTNNDEHSSAFPGYQYKYTIVSSFPFTEVTSYVFCFYLSNSKFVKF